MLPLLRANRLILDRVRLMQWISYRNFSYHHAIQFGPVERIATRFLPHNKRLDNMEAEFHLPCSQLLNLIFRSHKMKLSLIQKKVSSTYRSRKIHSTKSLGLRGIRVLEATSRREETNADGGTKWRQISKTWNNQKNTAFGRNQKFFGRNEKIFYQETLLPYV